jgi:hypothetical protein
MKAVSLARRSVPSLLLEGTSFTIRPVHDEYKVDEVELENTSSYNFAVLPVTSFLQYSVFIQLSLKLYNLANDSFISNLVHTNTTPEIFYVPLLLFSMTCFCCSFDYHHVEDIST